MTIKTNKELSQAIDQAITDSGYKRGYISDQLGIANQNLKKSIYKQIGRASCRERVSA